VLTKLCIIYYSLSFSFLGFSFPFPCQMNVPDLAPNLFEMKEKNQTNGKSPNLWPFVLLGSLSLSSAHFRPLPSVLPPPPPSGRLLLRGQDLFINAPALLSLPLDNTDGLFSHDHEVSTSLRLFSLSSLLRIIICLSKLS